MLAATAGVCATMVPDPTIAIDPVTLWIAAHIMSMMTLFCTSVSLSLAAWVVRVDRSLVRLSVEVAWLRDTLRKGECPAVRRAETALSGGDD